MITSDWAQKVPPASKRFSKSPSSWSSYLTCPYNQITHHNEQTAVREALPKAPPVQFRTEYSILLVTPLAVSASDADVDTKIGEIGSSRKAEKNHSNWRRYNIQVKEKAHDVNERSQ